jgi:hypothetical protein
MCATTKPVDFGEVKGCYGMNMEGSRPFFDPARQFTDTPAAVELRMWRDIEKADRSY